MARGNLTPEEVNILRENCYVSDVAENQICYTNEFKFLFIKQYMDGKKPTQIFREAGLDPHILGAKRIERAAKRWKESYVAGTLGRYKNRRIRKCQSIEIRELEVGFDEKRYRELFYEQQTIIERQRCEILELKEELKSVKEAQK